MKHNQPNEFAEILKNTDKTHQVAQVAFEQLDLDHNKRISVSEFKAFIQKLSTKFQIPITEESDITKAFSQLDRTKTNYIEFIDFKAMVTEIIKQHANMHY